MKRKKQKRKRALLYARVASLRKGETPDRLTHQIDSLLIFCQDHDIEICGIYSEVASGNSFDRKEFKRMLADLKSKKIKADLLLFTAWDRFTRNHTEIRRILKELKKFGIEAQATLQPEAKFMNEFFKQFMWL